MVLHVFTSFLGGVPLCIPYGLYSGTSLGGTTWRILGGYSGKVLSAVPPDFSMVGRVSLLRIAGQAGLGINGPWAYGVVS